MDNIQLFKIPRHVYTAILILQVKWELFRLGSKQTVENERDHYEVPHLAPAD